MKDFRGRPGAILGAVFLGLVLLGVSSCGQDKGTTKVPPPGGNNPGGGVGDNACPTLGAVKTEPCTDGSGGQTLSVCSSSGWTVVQSSCKATGNPGSCDGKVVFTRDVQPLIQKSCISCHAAPNPYTDYATAKALGRELARRVQLAPGNVQKMPPTPKPDISAAEKAIFQKWVDDGFLQNESDCGSANFGTLDLKYIETNIKRNLESIDSTDRQNSRYLVLSHRVNDGSPLTDLEQFIYGINKSINSISSERDIINADAIDPRGSIYRIDLRAYGITRSEWKTIEDGDPINFESNTTEGQQIKQLTGARKAWMHADNFTFAVQGGYNGTLYYDLMGIPVDLNQFLAKFGVDKNRQIDDFDATFAGGFGSPISINKNRIIARFKTNVSQDAYMWETFDPIELAAGQPLATRNFFENPLPAEANGQRKFTFDAGEYIFTLNNGLQGYALFAANGVRADFAPLNIVRDNETAFDPTIRNAFSCARCHEAGIIPMNDQIRASVLGAAANFPVADVEIVSQLYKSQNSLAAIFARDSRNFMTALSKVGYDPTGKPDPQNFMTDRLRADVGIDQVAALLFMSNEDFLAALNASAAARQRVGQLATGGQISFSQLLDVMPIFIRDFRLGQDPLGQ